MELVIIGGHNLLIFCCHSLIIAMAKSEILPTFSSVIVSYSDQGFFVVVFFFFFVLFTLCSKCLLPSNEFKEKWLNNVSVMIA